MNQSESFLSRWSRRKAQSGEPAAVSHAGRVSNAAAAERDGKEKTPAALPDTNEPTHAAFDPASLPTVESITAGTDIRPFLQPGVPAELTRAALRRAWTTDPAVRDFIGIAENQWDFNDPTAMPGFGPLTAADEAATLNAHMRGGGRDRLAQITDAFVSAALVTVEASGAKVGESVGQPQRVPPASATSAAGKETVALATEQEAGDMAARRDSVSDARCNRRSHGGALPRQDVAAHDRRAPLTVVIVGR
jgi:hypothetical protein